MCSRQLAVPQLTNYLNIWHLFGPFLFSSLFVFAIPDCIIQAPRCPAPKTQQQRHSLLSVPLVLTSQPSSRSTTSICLPYAESRSSPLRSTPHARRLSRKAGLASRETSSPLPSRWGVSMSNWALMCARRVPGGSPSCPEFGKSDCK
jgi:hypothetical protein